MPVCVSKHIHPLRQSQLSGEEDICCSYCGFHIDNLAYGCLDCMFYLHEPCSLMPDKNVNHPFHPQHNLELTDFHFFSCSSCHVKFENLKGLNCTICDDFAMDLRCATMSPIEYESDRDQIKHFTHQHPLIQCEKDGDNELICFACQSSSSSDHPMYGCTRCRHFLHKSCANLPPKIDHPFHPQHPLLLKLGHSYSCDSCHKEFQTSLSFRCDKCDFDLDIRCVQTAAMKCEGYDYIQHFSHQHPMIICEKDDDDRIECFACKSNSSSLVYGCIPCGYFLHKSCVDKFSKKIIHGLHPRHPLTLDVCYDACAYCQKRYYEFKYRCDGCNFYLDATCAMQPTTNFEAREQQDGLCYICNERSNSDHSCVPSQFNVHQSLTQLPETLEHSFHSHKLLMLLTGSNFWCGSCHRYFNDLPSYCCSECNFHMDVRCSLMSTIQYSDHEFITHFSHQHPLIILEEESNAIDCFACQKICPDPIYGCIQCKYFLHKSCLELPQEIEHPFHHFHPLKICWSHDYYDCNSCLNKCHGFIFRCSKCDFTVGLECAFLRPSIRYECHDHLLALIEGARHKFDCKAYNAACVLSFSSSEFKLSEHFFLRCAICDFDLHLLCGPLPSIIKHKCHLHALTLMDSVVEDDSDEYYCDVCEEERDPRLRVYYCEKCNFISHVHCVMTEIVSALKREAGEVKLRIVGELTDEEVEEDVKEIKSDNNGICTLKDLLDSLDEKETRKLESCFGRLKLLEESDRKVPKEECQLDKDEDPLKDSLKFIPLTNDLLLKAVDVNTLYAGKKAWIESSEYDYKVVDVNGYMITRELAPTLRKLFAKYGNVSAGSDFTPQGKSVVYHILCKVVNRMCRTMFNDLNGYAQLTEWYFTIKCVIDAGFNLEFDQGFFSMVYCAAVGMEAERHETKFGVRLNQRIEEANQKIAQLSAQLEELNKSKEQYESIINAPKTEEMSWNLRFAKALRWRSMGKLFF